MSSAAVSNSVLAGCPSDSLDSHACEAAAAAAYPDTAAISDSLPMVCLQGARMHAITEQQCIDLVLDQCAHGRGGSIFTMNLDHLRRFVREKSAADRYRKASIVTADGMPLIWASRLIGIPLPERVTGSSLIWTLSAAAARSGRSVYLLGGAPGTAENTASALVSHYPALRVAGIFSDQLELECEGDDWQRVSAVLAAAKPDIVFVALGSPKQEDLIDRLRDTLPAAWWLGVGIAFSFVSGEIPRAPVWMQRAGLEWMHRLAHEPRRLARRYLVDGLPFAATLLWKAAWARFAAPRTPNRDAKPHS